MDSSSRTYRFLPADLYTAGYRIVGKVMAGTSGIMGTMNDRTKSHLEVHDARLARIHMPTKLVDHFEVVRLVKTNIFALCAARREEYDVDGIRWATTRRAGGRGRGSKVPVAHDYAN